MDSVVITTIQAPTTAEKAMLSTARSAGMNLIAIGDRKTVPATWPEGARYVDVQQQLQTDLDYARLAPFNHYARKNIGYLIAMSEGAGAIFDTDDDNAPLENWKPRALETRARRCLGTGWVNVYQWFTETHVWPRGLPLDHVRSQQARPNAGSPVEVTAPIQQGLADGSPDVDAVWRLVMDRDIRFANGDSIHLPPGAWCPFNSQSTWWFRAAYPLMYLPSCVSFRVTDIWRSFIAQRCLWELGAGVVFHGPEMFQERNPHCLMRDFEEEIPGYLQNNNIRLALEETALVSGPEAVRDNCHRCYETMVRAGFIPDREMKMLEAWLSDLPSQ